jgi:hypothetical protein
MDTKPKSHEQETREIREELEALKKSGQIPLTQKELRELKRKQREEEAGRAKMTQAGILAKCATDGCVKVTVADMKNAFPSVISQIGGNAFRTQIDNKVFHEFLLSNNLTFSLPDLVFRTQI